MDSDGGSFYDGLAGGGGVEFDIRTGGNYTGKCSVFIQSDRVFLPWEHLDVYALWAQWMMAKGMSVSGGAGWGEIGEGWGEQGTGWGEARP